MTPPPKKIKTKKQKKEQKKKKEQKHQKTPTSSINKTPNKTNFGSLT